MTDQHPVSSPAAAATSVGAPAGDPSAEAARDRPPDPPRSQDAGEEAPLAGETTGRELAVRTIGFVPAFDGVRAMAVLLIVVIHVTGTFIPSQRERFLPGGFLGVDIFFVLSGFLITSILLREFERMGRIRMGRFYLGRILRLVPAIAALFLVQYLWATSIGFSHRVEFPSLFQAFTYLGVWRVHLWLVPGATLLNHVPGLSQLWSLAVEEQFYLVWPAILFVVSLVFRNRKVTLAMTGALIVAVALHRRADWGPIYWGVEYIRLDYRSDSLLIGAFAAQLWLGGWVPTAKVLKVAAWIGLAVVAWGVVFLHTGTPALYTGVYDLIAVAVAFALLALVGTDWVAARFLSLPPLRAIGMVSYGFYIWHPLAFAIIAYYGHQDHWSVWSQVVLGLALAAAITVLSWYVIERPFLLLKDHLRRGSAAPGSNSGTGLPSATSGAYR